MFQPPKKLIKLNDIVEQHNMFSNESKDTSFPCPGITPVQNAKSSKETIVNIDDTLQPLPKRSFQQVLKLTLKEPNANEKFESDFNNVNIGQRFPGLHNFRIQVVGQSSDSKNLVVFETRREITNAAPMLNSSKSSKRLPPKDNKYIESKHYTFAFQNLSIPTALFGKPGKLETRKIFKIEFEKYDAIYKEIILQVKVYSSVIKGDRNYVEATAPDMTNAIPILDYYFLNKRMESRISSSLADYHRSSDDAQRFFELMREYHMFETRPDPEDSVQDPRMLAQLLDYQKEAVVWMLSREGVLELSDGDNHSTEQLQKLLSMNINKRITLKAFGNKCLRDAYYSRTSGCISLEKQHIDKLSSRGGILADEMGLGKTIEMLSLILLHPRTDVTDSMNVSAVDVDVKILSFECTCGISDLKNKNIVTCCECGNCQHPECLGFNETSGVQVRDKYVCPYCIARLPTKPIKSTLIVVPNSILKQWEEEIRNNISDDSLKVYIYRGFSSGKKYVHPDVLSEYDVVLTTYEVLRQEIHFTDLTEEKRLRDPKRYAALPCPIMLIEWWRVCLDEAQMVENVNWSFSKMACMLPAVNRWCVTGTPIPNSLQDLYGVVCFLGIDPITDIKLWESLIMEPFKLRNSQIDITSKLFGKIFWRTEKEYVQDQMRLPRQTEVIHRLEFTPAEKYFYDQRSTYWINEFKAGIEHIERDQEISTLTNSQLLPFRTLRQICTHPQLDQEAFKFVDIFIERGAKLTLTVCEFVDWLVKRAVMRCQKQYKLQIVSLNALAALYFIENKLEVAAKQYRRVIELADENKDRWKTDDVHLLQALINLNDVYKKRGRGQIDRTLYTRVDELIRKLMQNKTKELLFASGSLLRASYNEINGNFGAEENAWWILVFDHIRNSTNNAVQLFQELVDKLKKTIPSAFMQPTVQPTVQPASDVFALVQNLQNTLKKNLLEIVATRKEIFSDWKSLNSAKDIPPFLNLSVLECRHFSESINSATSCRLCSFERKLSNYESLLNRLPQESDYSIEEMKMKSWTESILDVIYQFAKKYQLPDTMLGDAKKHIGQFCDLKNEIGDFWKWTNKIYERMTAIQSLLHETKPIKLNDANRTVAATSSTSSQGNQKTSVSTLRRLSVMEPMQISPRIQLEISALDLSNQKFKDCLRDLQYLKGLQIYGYGSNSSIVELNPETCPVDHPTQKWGFLPCGHFFCANCCSTADNYQFSCSICNEKFSEEVIRFIDMHSSSKHTVTNIPSWKIADDKIWRNPFTKVEGVIRTLLSMKTMHPNEKALVICSCNAMLEVLAAEFDQNGISYVMYKSNGGSKTNRNALIRYRFDSTQVLLMPLTVASTGLNITEANHVLLVEPILNLTIEQQAIGRIYRLGQNKQTFIHRFYVADTVEEELVRMDEEKKMSTFVEGNMTIQDLMDIFDNH